MVTQIHSVIVGLGKTGLSCARYLKARGVPFAVTDNRTSPPNLAAFREEFPDVCYVGGHFSDNLLTQAREIIVSPGVSLSTPEIAKQQQANKSLIGDVELFARENQKPVIAITGSNGKTTVTTVVGLMMQQAGMRVGVCGNIGEAVLDYLMEPVVSVCDAYVMELSSFQLETTHSLNLKSAVLLNISPDHLDRHVTMDNYLKIKQKIYHRCLYPVINLDEPHLWQTLSANQCVSFSLKKNSNADFTVIAYEGCDHLAYRAQPLCPVSTLKLQGAHHLQNALASLAIGHAIGLPFSATVRVLQEFSGLPHRCQWVRSVNGVTYYNDSKGTNVGATRTAIASLGEKIGKKIILIAGGQGKGADFSYLKEVVGAYVKQLVVIGQDAFLLKQNLATVVPTLEATSLEEAVMRAAESANPGDCVLLSPACASLDMFRHYEHRGEVFMLAVHAL